MKKSVAGRLRKRDLGPHAFEQRMPERIASLIAAEDESNVLHGVIPHLADLVQNDPKVSSAYLCDKDASQISKLRDEGAHFCGYRNIQMLCLALGRREGHGQVEREELRHKLLIPDLQDRIEAAWYAGFNQQGRVQTGGIKGTRKHVGSSEAEALLLSLGIDCTGKVFEGDKAWADLLDAVEVYFAPAMPAGGDEPGVHVTDRLPIFLQRPGHSMTIVGIERGVSGKRRLLVFDPAWQPPPVMRKPAVESRDRQGWTAGWALKRYRKSERYLKKWKGFETVSVD